jgi:hypothetical protein
MAPRDRWSKPWSLITLSAGSTRTHGPWPMPDRAEVLPVAGLLTRNTDIDLRRGELRWTARIA